MKHLTIGSLLLTALLVATNSVAQNNVPQAPANPGNTAAVPEQLGRLFLSPERRAALERQRQLNITETMTAEGESLSINGVVQRSNGHSTVWINQRAQHEDSASSAYKVHTNKKQPATLNVESGDQGSAQVKVGESINRATQERNDVVGSGAIRVGKTRP